MRVLRLARFLPVFEVMTRAKKIGCCFVPVALLIALFGLWRWNFSRTHQHCIKMSGTAFRNYAEAHEGSFPFHTNGFGDALLLLLKEDSLDFGPTNWEHAVHYLTGPGDNGKMFKEAFKSGVDVPEAECSRVYVQGLSEKNNPQIAILFDRRSTPGGDHGRRPWGPRLREVCLLDGTMETVREEKWARFAKEQIELLVAEGIPRAVAEGYYGLR